MGSATTPTAAASRASARTRRRLRLLAGVCVVLLVGITLVARAGTSTAPSAPRITSAAGQLPSTIRVSFTPPLSSDTPIVDYDVEYSTAFGFAAGTGTLFADGVTSTSPIDVTGLTNGTSYYFRVRATNAAGVSPWSEVTYFSAMPWTESDLRPCTLARPKVATGGMGEALLSWAQPPCDHGVPITEYLVGLAPLYGYQGITDIWHVPASAASFTVANLPAGSYSFAISAVSAAGQSAWSTPSDRVNVANVPSAPVDIQASSGSDHAATITFKPGPDGLADTTGYRATCTTAEAGSISQTIPVPSDAWSYPRISITTTGLTNGVPYSCTAAALSRFGDSLESADVTITPAPVPVDASAAPKQVATSASAVDTELSTCVLRTGSVYCTGSNELGELGGGTTTVTPGWTRVLTAPGIPLTKVTQLDGNAARHCARTATGAVYCWGAGAGAYEQPAAYATRVVNLPTVRSVSVGTVATCALTTPTVNPSIAGVYCWLHSSIMPHGVRAFDFPFSPQLVPGTAAATAVRLSELHLCVVLTSGMGCLGSNEFGQLGLPLDPPDQFVHDTLQPVLTGWRVLDLALSADHSCVLVAGSPKKLYCFGANDHAQLGTGVADVVPHPLSTSVDVVPARNAAAVNVGGSSTCATKLVGTAKQLLCWGDSHSGQLNTATRTDLLTPTLQPWTAGLTQADMSSTRLCVRKASAAVWCAGEHS